MARRGDLRKREKIGGGEKRLRLGYEKGSQARERGHLSAAGLSKKDERDFG